MEARWEYCTPDWVTTHNACGPAVRRPVLLACPVHQWCDQDGRRVPTHHVTGHEHLMVVQNGVAVRPIIHEKGEPA